MTDEKPNTLFLRLEGPLQAWGENSKFVIRRTAEAPTKSGVLGMICCAMGKKRSEVRPNLERLNKLAMGVRIDRPGTLWNDYHTLGAGFGMLTAQGKLKTGAQGTLVTRRFYLCDASFLVALQGDPDLIREVHSAVTKPVWPVYLGRKSCPPALPLVVGRDNEDFGGFDNLISALASRPWAPRLENVDGSEPPKDGLPCVLEWRSTPSGPPAPPEAEVWHDSPVSFDPPVHQPRLVLRDVVNAQPGAPIQRPTPGPQRPQADYGNAEYRKRRAERLRLDHHLCVFCKAPLEGRGATVQHITYRRAGGAEKLDDLRSLCRLCHDAVTIIEYGLGLGLDRINPEEPRWRDAIIAKRADIIKFRSLATRRRRLEAEEVE